MIRLTNSRLRIASSSSFIRSPMLLLQFPYFVLLLCSSTNLLVVPILGQIQNQNYVQQLQHGALQRLTLPYNPYERNNKNSGMTMMHSISIPGSVQDAAAAASSMNLIPKQQDYLKNFFQLSLPHPREFSSKDAPFQESGISRLHDLATRPREGRREFDHNSVPVPYNKEQPLYLVQQPSNPGFIPPNKSSLQSFYREPGPVSSGSFIASPQQPGETNEKNKIERRNGDVNDVNGWIGLSSPTSRPKIKENESKNLKQEDNNYKKAVSKNDKSINDHAKNNALAKGTSTISKKLHSNSSIFVAKKGVRKGDKRLTAPKKDINKSLEILKGKLEDIKKKLEIKSKQREKLVQKSPKQSISKASAVSPVQKPNKIGINKSSPHVSISKLKQKSTSRTDFSKSLSKNPPDQSASGSIPSTSFHENAQNPRSSSHNPDKNIPLLMNPSPIDVRKSIPTRPPSKYEFEAHPDIIPDVMQRFYYNETLPDLNTSTTSAMTLQLNDMTIQPSNQVLQTAPNTFQRFDPRPFDHQNLIEPLQLAHYPPPGTIHQYQPPPTMQTHLTQTPPVHHTIPIIPHSELFPHYDYDRPFYPPPYRHIRQPFQIGAASPRSASNYFFGDHDQPDDSNTNPKERHGLPIVDPQHPVVQNALNPLGNPIKEPEEYIKIKRGKIIDPSTLVPLEKTYVYIGLAVAWILVLSCVWSYHSLKSSMMHKPSQKFGLNNKPTAVINPPYGPPSVFFTKRRFFV